MALTVGRNHVDSSGSAPRPQCLKLLTPLALTVPIVVTFIHARLIDITRWNDGWRLVVLGTRLVWRHPVRGSHTSFFSVSNPLLPVPVTWFGHCCPLPSAAISHLRLLSLFGPSSES
jgi:hypothetical protein